MTVPMLQVALDQMKLSEASRTAEMLVDDVDVLEVGTLLCYAEGAKAVQKISEEHPKHIVLADLKVADAGKTAAEIVFSKGANWMTVICCASIATMDAALQVARIYDGDIQVELYGDWTFQQAKDWQSIGLKQVVYHRSRDAAAAGKNWGTEDYSKISKLNDMGFEVSVTGGLKHEDIPLFQGMNVKCFIAGRSLYQVTDPIHSAKRFKEVINTYWS